MIISASALDRLYECAASHVLPHSRRTSVDAARGIAIHAYLAAVSYVGEKEALAQAPVKYRDELSLIDLSLLPVDETKYLAEVAFALDLVTGKGRVLGQNIGRKYDAVDPPLSPNEVVGTADVVGLTEDAAVIPDFKCGHADLQPREMRQLLFLSLVACRAYGRNQAISGVIFLREDGSSYFKRVEFDAFDLDAFELELKDIVSRVAEAKGMLERGEALLTVEGDHCRYCPAFDSCPSKMSLVKQFAAAPESLDLKIEGATDEQLALAWERVGALKKVVERVEASIKTRARETPIPLGKGQVLGEVAEEEIKPEVASMVLEAMHGAEFAEASVKRTENITKSSIENALRRFVVKPGVNKITHLKEAAFQAIRDADGMDVNFKIQKHRPKAVASDVSEPPAEMVTAGEVLKQMLVEGQAEHEAATKAEAGT